MKENNKGIVLNFMERTGQKSSSITMEPVIKGSDIPQRDPRSSSRVLVLEIIEGGKK